MSSPDASDVSRVYHISNVLKNCSRSCVGVNDIRCQSRNNLSRSVTLVVEPAVNEIESQLEELWEILDPTGDDEVGWGRRSRKSNY